MIYICWFPIFPWNVPVLSEMILKHVNLLPNLNYFSSFLLDLRKNKPGNRFELPCKDARPSLGRDDSGGEFAVVEGDRVGAFADLLLPSDPGTFHRCETFRVRARSVAT